jgi:hypothetical protein
MRPAPPTVPEVLATPELRPTRRAHGTSVMQVRKARLITGCAYLCCHLPAPSFQCIH